MTLPPLEEAPPALVEEGKFHLGRFSSPPGRLNMLDVAKPYHYPVPRCLKQQRLKQWQAFQFGNQRFYFFTALYSAPPLNLGIFMIYDRERKRTVGFKRPFLGKAYDFSESLGDSQLCYRRRRVHFSVDCRWTEGVIELDAARLGREAGTSFEAKLRFSCGPQQAAPLSVCLPLGLNRAMYSTKALMPLEGELKLGGETFALEGPEAMGCFDDHKAYYPFRMHYDWVSGFGTDSKGRRIGFNLTDNQVKDQAKYNENCLWINNRIYSLPPVKVTRPQGPMGEWVIQDTEGLVDLIFMPECPNDMRFDFGIMASDYHGPFGSFRGVIRNGTGEKIDAERLFGAGEDKTVRA